MSPLPLPLGSLPLREPVPRVVSGLRITAKGSPEYFRLSGLPKVSFVKISEHGGLFLALGDLPWD